ncbi:MAG: glycine zipper family protein [Rhodospirillales bacterium]|nr:glycine zipper family protein [Rhodospirillales bacterium]MDE1883967.1 glycine zipper family protein [Rhodospirillales bacterium]MDE2390825.1 glycine zipper family protein [Rhodospirillales bacterium]MDE2458183.1 glycine zipper family protein [Rhodospirillales bacterium]
MLRKITGIALVPMLALGACTAVTPTQPTVVAMPGQGKSWNQFQADDAYCKSYAASQMPDSGQVAQVSQNNSTATAAAGTLIGAGVGAVLGSLAGNVGAGAAVGAGAGLLGGAATAGNNTQATADSLQGRYDVAYAQCMVGHGESIQQPAAPPYYAPPAYYAPPPPPPDYYYPGY